MPQVIDNPDGTKTFTINSSELVALRDALLRLVPDVRKVLRLVEAPEVRATVDFVKSVLT